ncbi:Clavaminate synthase-like protein [Xylariaceae sp. FL1019]|nr:Clavaminate synthase-like protein [Xylariaceae sp. FL1019]
MSPSLARTRLSSHYRVTNLVTLRDACACSSCVDPDSGQKRFATADVPDALRIKDAVCADDGSLHLTWHQDFFTGVDHTSVYSPQLWVPNKHSNVSHEWQYQRWDRDAMVSLAPFYAYDDFARDGAQYEAALRTLHMYGLVILRDVPIAESAVENIASRLGELQHTLYGLTWDVKSKPRAENVAYTNTYLGLHQDLLYLENAPRLQVLHCLANTCDGGESLFCDSRHLGAQLHKLDPKHTNIVPLNFLVRYHYKNNGHHYKFSRPLWNEGSLWWSPPFQDPFQPSLFTQRRTADWVKIARSIKRMTEDETNVYEYKMKPGECVIFDNRRILHGRRAFDTATGERWLKGAYVENSSHQSKLRSVYPPLAQFEAP